MGGVSPFMGQFEQAILVAIAQLEEAYGMTVRREIHARTGLDVSIGSVYITLDRLSRKGYITSALSDVTRTRGGRARRLFRLTPLGARVLRKNHDIQQALWKGLNPNRLGRR